MIEHAPWRGPHYETGIDGQRFLVVGHSHWHSEDDVDADDFTIDVVQRVVDGEWINFFTNVASYFGYEGNAVFWQHVAFMNYLPECVGNGDDRFGRGTQEQLARAKTRFLRTLVELKPDKALVFTNSAGKGWQTFPPTREEAAGNQKRPLGADFPNFSWGTYDADGHIVMAFGLRHPQGAKWDQMWNAVERIRQLPPVTV